MGFRSFSPLFPLYATFGVAPFPSKRKKDIYLVLRNLYLYHVGAILVPSTYSKNKTYNSSAIWLYLYHIVSYTYSLVIPTTKLRTRVLYGLYLYHIVYLFLRLVQQLNSQFQWRYSFYYLRVTCKRENDTICPRSFRTCDAAYKIPIRGRPKI